MHGLPIEFETLKHLGLDFHRIDPIELRAKCRERALHWLDVQRATILRMGVLGDYEHPYRTIDKEFEATIVETLGTLAEEKQLYKGLRSTLWCIKDETALAEAEIEYKDRTSPSIYVRFTASPAQRAELLARADIDTAAIDDLPLAVLIWTTTPWTLPANVAIALKAERRIRHLSSRSGTAAARGRVSRRAFSHAAGTSARRAYRRHPRDGTRGRARPASVHRSRFDDRERRLRGARFRNGRRAHGARPRCGRLRYGHAVRAADSQSGRRQRPFHEPKRASMPVMPIFDANENDHRRSRGERRALRARSYDHSYPHCWRCKNPVIFRATSQWFIAMDVNKLRKRIEEKIPSVAWFPAWGEHRMLQMIENHPEWCMSRQRTWGTPIPALVCRGCGEAFLDPDVARTVRPPSFASAASTGRNASDLWWTEPVETFLTGQLRVR